MPVKKPSGSSSFLWGARLQALIVKEFQQIWRDPSTWLIAGVLPLIFLLLFGYGISLDAGVLRIASLGAGAGPKGLEIVDNFAHSPWFEAIAPKNIREAELSMRDSQVQALLVFRPNFEKRLAADKTGSLELLIDGSEPNTARFTEMYCRRSLMLWQSTPLPGGQEKPAPISIQERMWYNPTAKSEYFLVPGSITVIMTLIGTLLTSLVFAREWERGTIETIFTSPVSRMQILLGKFIPYFCLGMCSMLFCATVAIILYNVPFRGSFLTLLLVAAIFMSCALGQGLLISISFKKQLVAAQAGLYTGFLPALLLSGFVFDIQSMPAILRMLSKILPATWFNICIKTLFLAGDIWAVLLPCMAALLALSLFYLGIVYIKLDKKLN